MEDETAQLAETDAVEAEPSGDRKRRRLKLMPRDKRHLYFLLLLLALFIAMLILTFIGRATGSDAILGWVAVFSLALLGAALPVWPVPGTVAAGIFAGLGFDPVLVAIAAGIAEPIGAMPYYIGGIWVEKAAIKVKGYSKVKKWIERRTTITLFLACVIPGPWSKMAYAISGSARYPFWKFSVTCFAGTTIKALGYAYAGYYISQAVS